MSVMEDFVDVKYNGTTFSSLGLLIVSGGNRFQEKLLPTSKETKVDIPGQGGSYFFGATETKLDISLSYAFDSLTEEQLNRVQDLFSDTKMHQLEIPEKNGYYMAKPTSNATLKHLCFTENGQRIYKGEGNVTFTAYWPYLQQEGKFNNETDIQKIENVGDIDGTLLIKIYDGEEINISFDSYTLTLKNIQWGKEIVYVAVDCEKRKIICFDGNDNQIKKRGLVQTNGEYFSFTPGIHTFSISGCEKYEVKYVCYSK